MAKPATPKRITGAAFADRADDGTRAAAAMNPTLIAMQIRTKTFLRAGVCPYCPAVPHAVGSQCPHMQEAVSKWRQ